MSMAAGYSRKAAAFTRSSPLLRVEITTERRIFRPVSDWWDSPTPSGYRVGRGPPLIPQPYPPLFSTHQIDF